MGARSGREERRDARGRKEGWGGGRRREADNRREAAGEGIRRGRRFEIEVKSETERLAAPPAVERKREQGTVLI